MSCNCICSSAMIFCFPKQKRPARMRCGAQLGWNRSLTMTYFHTGIRTIIGAKSFHCPVRDGKEWDQLAMVVRHNLLLARWLVWLANS